MTSNTVYLQKATTDSGVLSLLFHHRPVVPIVRMRLLPIHKNIVACNTMGSLRALEEFSCPPL